MDSGYIEKLYGKQKIALKFGNNAFELLCKMHGSNKVLDVGEILQQVGGERDLIFCAAQAASLSSGKEFKLNKYQIGDWLDDMSQEDYEDIVNALTEAKILGVEIKTLMELAEQQKAEEEAKK